MAVGLTSEDLEAAAAALAAGGKPRGPEAQELLASLDYEAAAGEVDGSGSGRRLRRHRAALLRAAASFKRVFELRSPLAPGLVCLGAELCPGIAGAPHRGTPDISVSGVGTTMRRAFEACIGEGIEYLSQLERGDEPLISPPDAKAPLAGLGVASRAFLDGVVPKEARPLDWCRVMRLADAREAWLPAEICLRRPNARKLFSPPFLLGTGMAAGESFEAAALHGLLELIERDAAALWWRGGERGRTIAFDTDAGREGGRLVAQLRQDVRGRKSWLLDITTDIGVPCVAALSCSADGRALAFGLSARPLMRDAAISAVAEMCQIELAYAVVEAKLHARGVAALNERDLAHLRRASAIDADSCALLHGLPARGECDRSRAPQDLPAIVAKLERLGVEVFALDLTRPSLEIPAVRVIAPGLQLEPSEMTTARLQAVISRTGGGAAYTKGEKLL